MKPTGPERDRKIAKIRGEHYQCTMTPHERKLKSIKPYSTNISAAMELWEEMKGAGELYLSYDEETRCICHIWSGGNCIVEYWADTEADAISGAYLQWKGAAQ